MTWTVDRTILAATSASVIGEIGINFATSYQHIYDLGLKFGETGTAARLQPAGVDLALLAFALGNLFLARHGRKHWFVWTALLFGLAGTVVANGAYGAGWSTTGMLLSAWAPVLLFATVEVGMILLKVAAETSEKAALEAAQAAQAARYQTRGQKAAQTRKARQRAALDPAGTDVPAAVDDAYTDGTMAMPEMAPKAGTTQLQGIGLSGVR